MLFLFAVPALTITIAEALGYSTILVASGYVAKTAYDSASDRDGGFERQGESRAKAAADFQLSQFEKAVKELRADENMYFNVILAVATVGYAYAASYGEVSDDMRNYIDDFVAGQGAEHLPPGFRQGLNELLTSPPNVELAYASAMALAPNAIVHCNTIIELLAERFEGSTSLTAQEFVSNWNQLKAAA
ncbi:hypothetical protein GALL_167400 [mine drainage metagenome]|uniref:Uncharacterized protein n=1 Tax=mine drainage metagenome TaxID=410659 RepID=A0A1J5SHU4_9ZZZZ